METVKILTIGDIHVKTNNLPEGEMLIKYLSDVIDEQQPDLTIVMGDTLDGFDVYKESAFNQAIDILMMIQSKSKLMVLIGNHDIPGPNYFMTKKHPFNALKLWKNTIIVDKCHIFEIKGIKFASVPYVPNGMLDKALFSDENYNPDIISAVFAHQQMSGCMMDGHLTDIGDKWKNSDPLLISGHIHQYQRLQNNIIYCGTPRQTSFRDVPYKTVSMFFFIKNANSQRADFTEVRIDIPIPTKITHRIHASQLSSYIMPENSKLKLYITGTKAEIAAVHSSDMKKYLESKGVIIELDEITQDYGIRQVDFSQIFETKSFSNVMIGKIKGNEKLEKLYCDLFAK